MWTAKNRGRYDRSKLRYPSDLTDDEWAHVEPLIPPAKRGGNKRHVEVREVMNVIMYMLSTGCQWRAIPKDLPPHSTLFDYLDLWSYDGTLDRIHHALYVRWRWISAGFLGGGATLRWQEVAAFSCPSANTGETARAQASSKLRSKAAKTRAISQAPILRWANCIAHEGEPGGFDREHNSVASVLIIGASRGIGLETVKAALEAGHSVRALARSARRIPIDHPKLTKMAGDALEMATVKRALSGVDVVTQSLGLSAGPEVVLKRTRV